MPHPFTGAFLAAGAATVALACSTTAPLGPSSNPQHPEAAATRGLGETTMSDVYTASTVIRRPPQDVFGFVRKPENQPRWAIAFVKSTEPIGGGKYRMETPFGPMTYAVEADAARGTVDFTFDTPGGPNVLPARVVPHPAGSMFMFTITRAHGMDEKAWSEGRSGLDLEVAELKKILEY
jgi:hypothetical protein